MNPLFCSTRIFLDKGRKTVLLQAKLFILASALLCLASCVKGPEATEDPQVAIGTLLDRQVKAWNEGNIDQFMEGYWKSDSLLFVGSEIATGWNATLNRYKRSYPDKDAMGSLRFEILKFNRVAADACLLTGKFFLTRKADTPHGIFTLLLRKKEGKWVIVYDHTSQDKTP